MSEENTKQPESTPGSGSCASPCSDSLFYEVVLSNCDGLDCTLHVWDDGVVDRVRGTAYAQKKLVPLFHDPEAPAYVFAAMRRLGWRSSLDEQESASNNHNQIKKTND